MMRSETSGVGCEASRSSSERSAVESEDSATRGLFSVGVVEAAGRDSSGISKIRAGRDGCGAGVEASSRSRRAEDVRILFFASSEGVEDKGFDCVWGTSGLNLMTNSWTISVSITRSTSSPRLPRSSVIVYAATRANPGSPACRISRSCGHTLEKYVAGVIPFGTEDTRRDAFASASVDNCPVGCGPPPPADVPRNISSML